MPRNANPGHEPKLGQEPDSVRTVMAATAPPPTPDEIELDLADAALRDSMDVQAEAFERARAARNNVPWAVWQTMDPIARKQVDDSALDQMRTNMERNQWALDANPDSIPMVEITEEQLSSLMDPGTFRAYARGQLGPQHFDNTGKPRYCVMCDPPIEVVLDGVRQKVHPDTSIISLLQVQQKRKAGFETYPKYRFLPKPTIPCEMTSELVFGLAGKPCEYKGRTQKEVIIHMQSTHPIEWQARERDEDRKARERAEERAAAREDRLIDIITEMRKVG